MSRNKGIAAARSLHHSNRRTTASPLVFPLHAAFALLTGLVLWLDAFLPGPTEHAVFWVGLVAMCYGAAVFVLHGSARITTLGLFNLTCSTVIGAAAVDAAIRPVTPTGDTYILYALLGSFAAQAAVTCLAWIRSEPKKPELRVSIPPELATRLIGFAVPIVVGGFVAHYVGLAIAPPVLVDGAVAAALTLIGAALLLDERGRLFSFRVLMAFAALALYAGYFHTGTGRLQVVAVAWALALIGSARFPSLRLKSAAIGLAPLAMWWMARSRRQLQESLSAGGSEGNSGLESLFSPLPTMAKVLEQQIEHSLPYVWGKTLLTTPFGPFPEAWRPEWVPPALGYDLVRITQPSKADTGFSEACTIFGEAVWNFGPWGLLIMVFPLAAAIIWIDRHFDSTLQTLASSRLPNVLVRAVILAIIGGSIADLVWGGTHTFGMRLIAKFPVLLIMAALAAHGRRKFHSELTPRR